MKVGRLTVLLVALTGLLSLSGVALAEHEESHPEDTWFSFGYDPLDHFIAINVAANDVDDCFLEDGSLTGVYGDETEGIYDVEIAEYEMCEISGTVVAGPNGQVNHGQFIKAAKSLFDIGGHGCVVRYLAQSDIGRTPETKVLAGDAVAVDIGDDGEFEFSTFEADCDRGNGKQDRESRRTGRPESPGKSGEAPGKNK